MSTPADPGQRDWRMERPSAVGGDGARPPWDAPEEGDSQQWPTLCSHLTVHEWRDGTAREPSTLLILFQDGVWKACLIDKATGRNLWVSSPVLRGVWDNLETALTSPRPDWRVRKDLPGRRK